MQILQKLFFFHQIIFILHKKIKNVAILQHLKKNVIFQYL